MKKASLFLLLIVFLFGVSSVQAFAPVDFVRQVYLDGLTVQRGYAVKSLDSNFTIFVLPKVLQNSAMVRVEQEELEEDFEAPDKLRVVSRIYNFSVLTVEDAKLNQALIVDFEVEEARKNEKKIFLWNQDEEIWEEMPTSIRGVRNLRVSLKLFSGRLMVMEKETMEVGHASWYRYKNCNCAASPDYPRGTELLVRNLDNGKEVVVTVNDYGPDRSIFPERIIDLDSVAFRQLGSLRTGVLRNIQVVPYQP